MDFFDIFLKLANRWGEGNVIRGEWWLDPIGGSLYADQDVGDVGHESLAADAMLNKDVLLDGLKEYYEKTESPEDAEASIVELKQYNSDDVGAATIFFNVKIPDEVGIAACGSAEKWADINKDIRLAYIKHNGAIMAINTDFSVWELTPNSIEMIKNFLWEELGEADNATALISVEEVKTHKFNSMPIDEFLQIKYPNQLWRYVSGAI